MNINHAAFIKLIANAHPDRVRLLFKRYGINASVSEQSLLNAIAAKGEPFVRDLAEVLAVEIKGNYTPTDSNLLGEVNVTGTAATTATTGTNKTTFDNILNWGSSLLNLLSGAGNAYSDIKNNLDGTNINQANQNAQMQYNVEMARLQAEQDAKKSQQTLIVVGVGVLVLVVVLLVIFKK